MSTFVYEAVEPGGRTVRGKLEAENQQSVLSKLQELRYHVVSVDERRGGALKLLKLSPRLGKVKLKPLVVFSRQFATMIDAGINSLKCLDILEQQLKDPVLKAVVGEARRDVVGGASLTEALSKHPRVFSKL